MAGDQQQRLSTWAKVQLAGLVVRVAVKLVDVGVRAVVARRNARRINGPPQAHVSGQEQQGQPLDQERRPSKSSQPTAPTRHTRDPQPQTESRFFALPAELRNYIYELALPTETHLPQVGVMTTQDYPNGPVTSRTICDYNGKKVSLKAPGLLLACKQMHSEAYLLYCHNTMMVATDPNSLELWLTSFGEKRVALMRKVRFSQAYFKSWVIGLHTAASFKSIIEALTRDRVGHHNGPKLRRDAFKVRTRRTAGEWIPALEMRDDDVMVE